MQLVVALNSIVLLVLNAHQYIIVFWTLATCVNRPELEKVLVFPPLRTIKEEDTSSSCIDDLIYTAFAPDGTSAEPNILVVMSSVYHVLSALAVIYEVS